ncbi:MAG: Lrp/AsnC family transcriptional regulator [SAR202 cluster bacterium]|nr:Lrp/AsnC family transcriptional regulator [SAR202 cluster bacterium]|tara:strand:- start:355 stop:594 length:240 start_codon:yes stop_codon:yes gene_type:complete
MAKAFIMITAEPSETQRIGERLRNMRGAVVYEVLGPFDFIVDMEADTPEDLTSVLRNNVRSISGVSATLTCTVIEDKDK